MANMVLCGWCGQHDQCGYVVSAVNTINVVIGVSAVNVNSVVSAVNENSVVTGLCSQCE